MAASKAGVAPEAQGSYKIKRVDFLNRHNVPIILQNENGPCPLLAISNVLFLRNNLNIHPDVPEISLSDLLSLVAHRLLDTNLSNEGRSEAYEQNRRQNVSDVIAMLPRLATGIDVNVRYRSIHDFEYTPETAVFDLLDIGLVHGWLVDPQDVATASVVGSQSYNTLVEKLVALREAHPDIAAKLLEGDSPNMGTTSLPSKSASTETDPSQSSKGEAVKQAGEMREKQVSSDNQQSQVRDEGLNDDDDDDDDDDERPSLAAVGRAESSRPARDGSDIDEISRALDAHELSESKGGRAEQGEEERQQKGTVDQAPKEKKRSGISWSTAPPEMLEAPASKGFDLSQDDSFLDDETDDEDLDEEEESVALKDNETGGFQPSLRMWLGEGETMADRIRASEPSLDTLEEESNLQPSLSDVGRAGQWTPPEEGKAEAKNDDAAGQIMGRAEDELSAAAKEGLLIYNFLSSTASQLTYHGLFSLQERIKERELCVFFRNNHFNTMFKYNGSLYILATDQGYYNQANLVWEKLSQVDGDTQYVTGDFQVFHAESLPKSWTEEDEAAIAAAATRDIPEGPREGGNHSNYNSDLQLALALQQQELKEQKSRQGVQQEGKRSGSQSSGASSKGQPRPTSGPSVPLIKADDKKKDGCKLM